jgi:hypothetical protein
VDAMDPPSQDLRSFSVEPLIMTVVRTWWHELDLWRSGKTETIARCGPRLPGPTSAAAHSNRNRHGNGGHVQ